MTGDREIQKTKEGTRETDPYSSQAGPLDEAFISPVALSTMWGIGRFVRLADFVHQARELGFTHVELNYQIPPSMMEEALSGVALPISSLHSPTPSRRLPDGRLTHQLSLTSLDPEEREAALRYAEETIEYAARLIKEVDETHDREVITAALDGYPQATRPVVVHLGGVPLKNGLEYRLRDLYNRGLKGTEEYEEVRERLWAERQAAREPYLEAAWHSLERLVARARELGVVVALEVRYYVHEIPSLEEMEEFLLEYPDGSVGYWHDVGHAENLSRLGIVPHEEWLRRLSHRIVGVHLHDILGLADHRALGKGDLDLAIIAPYLRPDVVRVCEFAPFNTDEEVRQGLAALSRGGII